MNSLPGQSRNSAPTEEQHHRQLIRALSRLNTLVFAVVMGLGAGMGLFLATHLSLAIMGARAGRYLDLLGIFFPGYSATPGGAWIGLLWGFVFGAVSGGLLYWLYARATSKSLRELYLNGTPQVEIVSVPILRISSGALGTSLGCIMALQIFLTTGWLVLRGTAGESVHAALLSNYLPWYSVSLVGGLIGAVEIFAITYFAAFVLGEIYNFAVARRHGRSSR